MIATRLIIATNNTIWRSVCQVTQIRLYNANNQKIVQNDETNKNFEITDVSTKPLNEKEKLLRVAMIGVPNVGKSTLINALVEHRVCPVSRKVHTTRNFSRASIIRNDTQIVFFDTPGIVREREVKKHHLEKAFMSAYRHAIQHADIIGVIHDVSNSWTRNALHPSVINVLNEYNKLPSFLVLNKIDEVKSKRVLLDLIRTLTKGCLNGQEYGKKFNKKFRMRAIKEKENELETKSDSLEVEPGYSKFSEVFIVSAINGDGAEKIMDYLYRQAKPKQWIFDADTHTDRSPEELIVESVQAKLLDFLPQEIPYQLKSQLEFYSVDKGHIYASVVVTCPNKRIEQLVCGVQNGKLRQIAERITSDLIETFEAPVSFTINTISKSKE